jgi:hypothetical protein
MSAALHGIAHVTGIRAWAIVGYADRSPSGVG